MKATFNGRLVSIESVDGEGVDAYITEAYYVDTEKNLTDDELEELTAQCPDTVWEMAFEKMIDRADALHDRMKEGW